MNQKKLKSKISINEFDKLFTQLENINKDTALNYKNVDEIINNLSERLKMNKDSNDSEFKKQLKYKPNESEIIKFNIGGQVFSTLRSTITKRIKKSVDLNEEENSYYGTNLLEGLINGMVDVKYDKNESIFIDRNPQYFNQLLDYLRYASIEYELPETNDNFKGLLKEAEYFNIEGLVCLIKSADTPKKTLIQLKIDSLIIELSQIAELYKLCQFEETKELTLLYRATRDGFESIAFHELCANSNNTLTIIRTNDGEIFGGFTSLTWSSIQTFQTDPKAFLFYLINIENEPAARLPVKENLVYYNHSCGPIFGGISTSNQNIYGYNDCYYSDDLNYNGNLQHDLVILDCSNSQYSSFFSFKKDGTNSFDSYGYSSKLFYSNEIEIFQVN